MRETKIQWCDSTVNPTMGCDGCEIWGPNKKTCYAGVMHARYRGTNSGFAKDFNTVELFPGRMAKAAAWSSLEGKDRPDKPWLNGMPRTIFVSDMSDALSMAVPPHYLVEEIIEKIDSPAGRRHIWMWLTKRPRAMGTLDHLLRQTPVKRWPDHLWAMTSVTSQATARRVDELMKVGHVRTVRGVSFEPILGPIDFDTIFRRAKASGFGVDWAIFGGESGEGAAPCTVSIIEDGLRACDKHGVRAFVKQLGARPAAHWLPHGGGLRCLVDSHGGDWTEWPQHLRRREMPILRTEVLCPTSLPRS